MNYQFLIPGARIAGHYTLALIAVLVPEVGENRFIVASLLAFFFGPVALYVSLKLKDGQQGTVEPLVDMCTLLVIVAFIPEIWLYALIVGAVVALAPSIAFSDESYRYYAANSALLLVGMGAIAWYHDVQEWLIPLGVLIAIFPSTLVYSYSLSQHNKEIRTKAESLTALQLISGGIAHDFNNILMGIAGYAEVARLNVTDPEKTRDAVTRISGSTEKARQLINQLITFAGDKQAEFRPVEFQREIKSILQSVEGTLKKGIELKVDLPRDAIFVNGDSVQIGQIVLNLVVNAIESIKSTGKVDVRLKVADGMAIFEVEDTGSGIDASRQEDIFEPFFTGKERGHGLGLAVVKNIVTNHDGEIAVQSRLNRGSLFQVRIPNVKVEQPDPAGPLKKILIADDEQAIRMIVRQALVTDGYEVIEASDGSVFEQLFEQHKHELCAAILDVKMPGKTGWQCLETVRQSSKQLPVLVITGYDPHGPKTDEPDLAMRLLAKPFRISEIKETIADMLAKSAVG